MTDEQKYSHRLVRDSIFPKLILLRNDLLKLSKDKSIPFAIQLAIKCLANDSSTIEDVLYEYVTARAGETE